MSTQIKIAVAVATIFVKAWAATAVEHPSKMTLQAGKRDAVPVAPARP
jgi:hypothetical protein